MMKIQTMHRCGIVQQKVEKLLNRCRMHHNLIL
nr:MAG TPA: hypothetical protein [Caudoviricetes sp.]